MAEERLTSPLQSRKFIAFLLSEMSWKIIILACLWLTKDILLVRTDIDGAGVGMWWFMWTVVIIAGFVEVGYIGGQVWLDRYVDVARIVANGKPPGETGSPPGGEPPSEGETG